MGAFFLEDREPPAASRLHTDCSRTGDLARASCWILFSRKRKKNKQTNKKKNGFLLCSTKKKKGEGAVPLAAKQVKLLVFLIIADGGRDGKRPLPTCLFSLQKSKRNGCPEGGWARGTALHVQGKQHCLMGNSAFEGEREKGDFQ